MEENTPNLTEETAPQVTEEQNTNEDNSAENSQSATSEENNTEQSENNAENTENNGQKTSSSDNDQKEDATPYMSLRYNHETKELTQAEAVDYVQRAMYSEPIISDLRLLAAQSGAKNISEFVKNLRQNADNMRREELKEQLAVDASPELLETILEAENAKIKQAAGIIEQEEKKTLNNIFQDDNERLAAQFIELNSEFPNIKEFKDVPATVLQIASKNNISLLDAQLRFLHSENKKIKESEQTSSAAAETSAGSAISSDTNQISPEIEAMRRGVWQ